MIDNTFEITSLPETGVVVAAHQSIYWIKKKGGLAVLINRFNCKNPLTELLPVIEKHHAVYKKKKLLWIY